MSLIPLLSAYAPPENSYLPLPESLASNAALPEVKRELKIPMHAWLALEVTLQGPALWDRVLSTLPPSQSDGVRQQLDSLLDQFVIAGLEDDAATRRDLVEAVRAARQANTPFDRDHAAETPLGRLFLLHSFDGQSLARQVLNYFGSDNADETPLVCRNLGGVARALTEKGQVWAEFLDRPETPAAPVAPKTEVAAEHLRRGIELLESGEYRQAIANFTSGLKLDSAHAELYARRGEAYRLLGEAQRALSDYHIALHLKPESVLALMGRAAAHLAVGDAEKAKVDAGAAIDLGAKQPLAYRTRAAAAIALEDFDAALDDLSTAIELDADDAESLHRRGKILFDLGEIEKAVFHFNRVIEILPQHVPTLLYRGHARRSLGDHSRAVRDYSDVLRVHPSNALAYTSRGLAYELSGDRERALADHTEALRLEPDNVASYLNRAKVYRVVGDLAKSKADLDEVLTRKSDHFAALYHRGKIALARGLWQQALDDLNAVIDLNPELGIAFASRAVVRDRLNLFNEALADADEAVDLEPDAVTYLIRGRIASHLRETAAAVEDLSEAIRRNPQLPLAYQERSIAHTIQGDYDLALTDAHKLISLEPGNAQAYAHRSMVLHLRGEIQASLVDYTKALQLDPRVLITGWNQPLADHLRNQTSILLGDAIDGLRLRRNFPGVPDEPDWTIVVGKPQPEPPKPVERKPAPTAPTAKEPEAPKPAAVLPPSPPGTPGGERRGEGGQNPSQTLEPAPAAPKETPEPKSAATAAVPVPKRAVETMPQVAALDDTAASTPAAEPPPAPKPAKPPVAKKKSETQLASETPVKEKKPSPKPRQVEITPTVDDDVIPIDDAISFEESVDRAIEDLFASGPGESAVPPQKTTAASRTIAFANPPAPTPTPAEPAPTMAIDCPMCRQRKAPGEILSGGRFRCASCNAVFFPSAATPSQPFPSTPAAKTRPAAPSAAAAAMTTAAKRPARNDDDDDAEPTLLDKLKRPTPMAIGGLLAVILLYLYFPTNLFGNWSHYSVHPATGVVHFDGKPLPKASIALFPINPASEDHPRPKAVAGPDGTFTLETYGDGDGAPAGDYKVQIVLMAPPTAKELKEERVVYRNLIPARYANPETSGLTVKIAPGTNQLPPLELGKKR